MRSGDGALTQEEQQAQNWDIGIVKPSLSLIQVRYAPPQQPPTQTRPLLSSLLMASVAHRSSTPTTAVASVEGGLELARISQGLSGTAGIFSLEHLLASIPAPPSSFPLLLGWKQEL